MHTVLVRFPRSRKKSPGMRDRRERLAALESRKAKMLSELRVLEAQRMLLPREKRMGDEGQSLDTLIAKCKAAIRSADDKIERLNKSFTNPLRPPLRMRAIRRR